MPRSTQNSKKVYEEVSDNARSSENETEDLDLEEPATTLKKTPSKAMSKGSPDTLTLILNSLSKLHDKFDTLHSDIHHPDKGVEPRLVALEKESGDTELRLEQLEEQNKLLRKELDICKGLIQRQHHYQKVLEHRVEDQAARSMSKNITISGIPYDKDENCGAKVLFFLKNILAITCEAKDILVAHRLGGPGQTDPMMIATLTSDVKDRVFKNIENIKGKKNPAGQFYFINQQRPEGLSEKHRVIRAKIKEIKAANEHLPKDSKIKYSQKKEKLFIEGELYAPKVTAPEPVNLFPHPQEQQLMDNINILYTPNSVGEHGSRFWGAAVRVSNVAEVNRAYRKIRQDYPSEDKIMMAYIIKRGDSNISGYEDDHEHGGGYKVLKTMVTKRYCGIAIFVLRQYGGQHLGKKRFQYIEEVTNESARLFPGY